MKSTLQSIRNVYRNRGRQILIVTLLGASLMFVAATMSLSASSQQELATIHQLVGNTITIQHASNGGPTVQQISPGGDGGGPSQSFGNGPTPIPDSVVAAIKRITGVVSTQESLSRPDMDDPIQSGMISGPNGASMNAPLTINGISSDTSRFTFMEGITPTLVSGRVFRPADATANVALVSQTVAQANKWTVGSTFTLKGTTFTIIGIYTTSNQLANSSIIIPMASMEKVFKLTGVDEVTVTAASYDQVEPLAARLRQALGAQFEVDTQTAKYRDVFSALQVAQQSIQVARVTSLIIAAAVIIFAVLQLVRERISEIAILKALGTSHLQVLWQFWIEILTLSATAAAFAILLLATLGTFIAQRFDIDPASLVKSNTGPGKGPGSGAFFVSTSTSGSVTASTDTNPLSNIHLGAATLNPQTLLIIVGLVVGLALLASFIPIWFVSTLKPAQVLRKAS